MTERETEEKNVDLPKSARLDYFGRGGTRSFRYGIYPGSADPAGKELVDARIRHARVKQESFDACEEEGNEVTQFRDGCTSRGCTTDDSR